MNQLNSVHPSTVYVSNVFSLSFSDKNLLRTETDKTTTGSTQDYDELHALNLSSPL